MTLAVNRSPAEDLSEFSRAVHWTEEHWRELLAQYPEQFIGVCGQQVVAASKDLDDVLDRIEELHALRHAHVVYVTDYDKLFLLPG